MTNDDYEDLPQLGEILRGIFGRLARGLDGGEVVVVLADWVRDHPRPPKMEFTEALCMCASITHFQPRSNRLASK